MDNRLEEERDNQLALQLEPFPLSRSILCMFPTVGTVFRVVLDKAMEKYVLHSLKIGEWVKLLDLRCEVNAGLWFGVLKSDTKLQYIPKEDDLILSLERFVLSIDRLVDEHIHYIHLFYVFSRFFYLLSFFSFQNQQI